jgi:hypothetical protein
MESLNGVKPKGLLILSGTPADLEDRINALSDDYALMGGVAFTVVRDELRACACMIAKAELRKMALAQPGMR